MRLWRKQAFLCPPIKSWVSVITKKGGRFAPKKHLPKQSRHILVKPKDLDIGNSRVWRLHSGPNLLGCPRKIVNGSEVGYNPNIPHLLTIYYLPGTSKQGQFYTTLPKELSEMGPSTPGDPYQSEGGHRRWVSAASPWSVSWGPEINGRKSMG